MHLTKRPNRVGRLLALTALLPTLPVFAQTVSTPAVVTSASTEIPDDSWKYSLGVGAFETPRYPGASASRFQPAPLVGVSYGRYFFGSVPDANVPFGLGAFLYRNDQIRVGAALSYDLVNPREQSDDSHLDGLPDIDRTAHATLFASYRLDWFSIAGSLSQDVAGKHEGTTASLDLLARYSPLSKLTLTAGPGVTWGSAQYNQTFFGINAEDSARSGLPAYEPGSGVAAVRMTAAANYVLDRHWSLGARISVSRLPGTVGSSPIVEKKTQSTYGAFINYAF